MITVTPLETPGLGDRSYVAHDGAVALVVDPQRDYDRVLAIAEEADVRITHVFETHVHNDYVSGGLALAREVGAAYHVHADDPVDFDRTPVRAGDVVPVGDETRVRVLHTPGHTHHHLAYVLEDTSGEPAGVFTGGSLLYGSTGRPDLLGPDHTPTLVRDQWHSAQRLADLPDHTPIYPTHGFGSFCSATSVSAARSTIGEERTQNPALTQDEETYVQQLIDGLGDYPAYYAHMTPANLAGPSAPDLTPPESADPAELRQRLEAGEWLVDLRHREAFAAGHLPGTYNLGLDGPFITYLGWLIPWGTPVTLLGETPERVSQAQREMARIGLDNPAAQATGDPGEWTDGALGSFPTATFSDLHDARSRGEDLVVLDVRRAPEYDEQHVTGAVNVPIHQVLAHLDSLPSQRLWIHCGSGYRASVVASVLAAHRFDVVAVDEAFDKAGSAGLELVA